MSDDIEHKSDINLVIPLINKLLAVARAGPVNNFHPSLWVLARQAGGRCGQAGVVDRGGVEWMSGVEWLIGGWCVGAP